MSYIRSISLLSTLIGFLKYFQSCFLIIIVLENFQMLSRKLFELFQYLSVLLDIWNELIQIEVAQDAAQFLVEGEIELISARLKEGNDLLIIVHQILYPIFQMKTVCYEHGNPPEFLCLVPSCNSRLMCLLCEHNHQLFESLRKVNQVDVKVFNKRVDEQIDKSIAILEELEAGGIKSQQKKIEQFYESIKADVLNMLEGKKKQNVRILSHNSNSDMDLLIRARIEGKYHDLPGNSFEKIKQVWQGMDLITLAREEKRIALESAYETMKSFYQQCGQLFSKFHIKLKCQVPEIRIAQNTAQTSVFQNYDEEMPCTKLQQKLLCATKQDQFSSLISDCYSGNNEIISISYDKTLRVFDKKLNLLAENEFNNILMRIQPIAPDVFGVGVSKELHIVKLSEANRYQMQKILILRGHRERIGDIHSLNSRIIGSCSEEGTKIWDLYKEKCQYTIKEATNPSCIRYIPSLKNITIGYHSHELKLYTLEKIRPIRCYFLPQTPLCLSQENRNENLMYCGGFRSSFSLFDFRVSKQVFTHDLKSEAITCFKQSLFEENSVFLGQRGGKVRVFDLRKSKTRLEWVAHEGMTNVSKPNGVVRIFQENSGQLLTAGCNDQRLALWCLEGE